MFGIPFSRPFTSPFGIPFLGGLGGTPTPPQPPFPSGFSEYWNAYDESLINTVTGVSIDAWTGTSVVPQILTQATSANQPSFIENGVATQSIVANQPTLIDTGGGVLAVEFDADDKLNFTNDIVLQDFKITAIYKKIYNRWLQHRKRCTWS